MKSKKNKSEERSECDKGRRSFITKLGQGILAASAISIISLTSFSCSKDDDGPGNGGGY